MRKINKEYFWLCYLILVSVLGILLLTGRMQIPSVGMPPAEKMQEQKPETENLQKAAEQEEENAEENQTVVETNPLAEEYGALLEETEEKERLLTECQKQIAAEEEKKFAILHKYEAQMEGIRAEYLPLVNYSVKNFEAKYDTGGSKVVQDVNQINYAIGELSKYTPWGITMNMFTSMAIDNSNADYAAMVNANAALGTGMQKVIVDTRAETEKFTVKLDFYEMLTLDSQSDDYNRYTDDKIRTMWENQYLMEYALKGQNVDMEPYAVEVQKKLYIMGAATKTLENYYSTLLTDCDSKTRSINQLEEQYQEIMNIVDPDGTGEIADMVQPEELEKYIAPLVRAGMEAANGYARLESSSPLVDSTWKYTTHGRLYWHYKAGLTMVNCDDVHIYYAGGKPVYVNGYYFYNGRLLNGNGNEDASVLYDEAVWMEKNSHAKKEECVVHLENILAACGD